MLFKGLRVRFLSSCVLISLLGVVFFVGVLGVQILSVLLVVLLSLEWTRLCRYTNYLPGVSIMASVLYPLYMAFSGRTFLSFGVLFLTAGIGSFLSWFAWRRRFLWTGLGILYIGIPFLCVAWIMYHINTPIWALVWMIGVVASSDIGGYICGRLIGGPKLLPEVSPNKTWAGFFGGFALSICVGTVSYGYINGGPIRAYVIAGCAIITLLASVGDLFESMIKRFYGVKDTGTLIPGHGGVFDRVDSYLFAVPVLAWMLYVFPTMFAAGNTPCQEPKSAIVSIHT